MSEPIIEMANPNSGENVEIEMEIQANDAVSAAKAEAYAVGERTGVPVTAGDPAYHNNSKYYAQQAGNESDEAEAWAKGTKDGTDVPTTDPAYHNNAKYFRDMAQQDANAAAGSATEAAGSAATAAGYETAAQAAQTAAEEAAQEAIDTVVAAQGPGIVYMTQDGEFFVLNDYE